VLGVLCGVVFWFDRHPDDGFRETSRCDQDHAVASFLQPLGDRNSTVTLPVHSILAGAIVGLLISLPDAFGLNSYVGVLAPVFWFGALTAWAVKIWGT
jgi:hypothetical protein